MIKIYLGLGSNVGNREKNMVSAIEYLEKAGVKIMRRSHLYETEPVGFTDQDWFLNMVVEGETEFEPPELAEILSGVEKKVGRTKTFKWGPRVIDIDLLFYGNRLVHSKNLTVPHKHLHERQFVLKPLFELVPRLVHPGLKKTIRQLLNECPDTAIVRPL